MKNFFFGDCLKNFSEDVFFLESTCACVLGLWPWPRAFLSLASRGAVLGRDVLGFDRGFFVSLALASSLVSSTPPLENSLAASGCATEHQPSLVIPLKVHFPANPLHDQLSSQNSPCPTCFSIQKPNDLKSLPVALLRMVAP